MRHYDQHASSRYNIVNDRPITLSYGSGDVIGLHVTESVCLSTTSLCEDLFCKTVCVNDMNMLSVSKQSEMLQTLASDGLLGLSPSKIEDVRPDLFIDLAHAQG